MLYRAALMLAVLLLITLPLATLAGRDGARPLAAAPAPVGALRGR